MPASRDHSRPVKRIDRALLRLTNSGFRARASLVHTVIARTGFVLPTSAVAVFDQLEERSMRMSELGELWVLRCRAQAGLSRIWNVSTLSVGPPMNLTAEPPRSPLATRDGAPRSFCSGIGS